MRESLSLSSCHVYLHPHNPRLHSMNRAANLLNDIDINFNKFISIQILHQFSYTRTFDLETNNSKRSFDRLRFGRKIILSEINMLTRWINWLRNVHGLQVWAGFVIASPWSIDGYNLKLQRKHAVSARLQQIMGAELSRLLLGVPSRAAHTVPRHSSLFVYVTLSSVYCYSDTQQPVLRLIMPMKLYFLLMLLYNPREKKTRRAVVIVLDRGAISHSMLMMCINCAKSKSHNNISATAHMDNA